MSSPFQAQEALDRPAGDLAAHGTMKILSPLDGLAIWADRGHAALRTIVATTAVTGKDLDAVQGGHDLALHPAGLAGLITLQPTIDRHQDLFEWLDGETGQAIAQSVVAKGTGSPDALWQLRLGQVGLQFFEAA